MANLDYPGPCPSCTGNDGCSTEAVRQAVTNHCKGLEQELDVWKNRMSDTMVVLQNSDSANQIQTRANIDLLKSHLREIDGILGRIEQECPVDLKSAVQDRDGACVSPGWLGG